MKSKYLISADIEPGDRVLADDDPQPVTVTWIGECFARVRSDDGYEWSVMRNRLTPTKAADAVDFCEAIGVEIS